MFNCHHLWSRPLKLFVGLVLFSIFGTILVKILGWYTGLSPGYIPQVASLLLIGTGVWIVARALRPVHLLLGVLVLGAVVEIIGIYQEVPFGSYLYTNRWWPVISLPDKAVTGNISTAVHFPLQLPFAWLMIVGGTYASLSVIQSRRWPRILWTAVIATLLDFFMEEVMVRIFKYWTWMNPIDASESRLPGGAPWLNSLGWFGVSFVGAVILSFSEQKEPKEGESNEPAIMLLLYAVLMFVTYLLRS